MAKITQGFACPYCGVWTRVLRTTNNIRRRECANLHRFYTEEVILGPSNIKSNKKEKENESNTK